MGFKQQSDNHIFQKYDLFILTINLYSFYASIWIPVTKRSRKPSRRFIVRSITQM